MRYFREVEVAKVCYVYEAVEWMVLGRVPDFAPDDAGTEIRGNYVAFLNDYHIAPDPLTPAEFKHFGGTLDYDAYLDALYGIGLNYVMELSSPLTNAGIAEWQDRYNAAVEKDKVDRKRLLDDELAVFSHEIERAKLQVMAAIVQNKVCIRGYWAENEDAFYEAAHATALESEVIPPEIVSPSNFSWEDHTLSVNARMPNRRSGGAFFLITMDTEEMLRTFEPPTGQHQTFRVINGNAMMDAASSPDGAPRRMRGRPPKANWLRDGMRDWYASQLRKGSVGRGKLEADIAAAIGWAKASGHDVSRSTVQAYLSDLIKGNGSR